MFNIALSYYTPPAFVSIKWKTYLIFGALSFAMALHVFFCFPEAAGKTLEEVEGLATEGKPSAMDSCIAKAGFGKWGAGIYPRPRKRRRGDSS
jgi:hypothetical protein